MQAARITDGKLSIEQVDAPTPRQDHALVRISASGVCHSDLHLFKGDWHGMQPPVIGHEAIGVVEALGPGAERFVSEGDRVILGLGGTGGGFWCGACEYCLGGEPRFCSQSAGVMGTFAEQFSVYARGLVTIPDSLPDTEAPLACGGLTAYGALKKLVKHGIGPGRTIGIIGAAGGLGHYAVQLASAFGYRVVAVDIGEDKLEFTKSLGADVAVSVEDAVSTVKEMGRLDAVLVFAARVAGFQLGLELLRPKGLFVGVGIPPTSDGALQLDPWDLFRVSPTIIFSAVGTVQDMRELVDLAVAGKVKTHVGRTGGLSELETVFDELESAAYLGRAVITDLAG